MHAALSKRRDALAGSKPDLSIYQFFNDLNASQDQVYRVDTPEVRTHYGGPVEISVTTMGHILDDDTPRFLVLHGVPTNKKQWYPVAKYLALFGYVACIDMLGMGMSSKPRLKDPPKDWMWKHHLKYIRPLAKQLFGPNPAGGDGPKPFLFISDDWGSGIHVRYAARYPQDLERNVLLDPVAFDGYPVPEIEAIGRAYNLPDETFQLVMGAFDQTALQIMKTMTYDPNVTNQYNQRDLLEPYADKDYDRPGWTPSKNGLKFDAIRVLSEMASALTPDQLLPYDPDDRPEGVQYDRITRETLVAWGEFDNMMPAPQTNRFQAVLTGTSCSVARIPRAGHFAGLDQPELVAETILGWLNKDPSMRRRLNDVYFGLTGVWKGDERHVVEILRVLYGTDARLAEYQAKRRSVPGTRRLEPKGKTGVVHRPGTPRVLHPSKRGKEKTRPGTHVFSLGGPPRTEEEPRSRTSPRKAKPSPFSLDKANRARRESHEFSLGGPRKETPKREEESRPKFSLGEPRKETPKREEESRPKFSLGGPRKETPKREEESRPKPSPFSLEANRPRRESHGFSLGGPRKEEPKREARGFSLGGPRKEEPRRKPSPFSFKTNKPKQAQFMV
jgi:pimeloyl-ACP methyl ester carboxylesterase